MERGGVCGRGKLKRCMCKWSANSMQSNVKNLDAVEDTKNSYIYGSPV